MNTGILFCIFLYLSYYKLNRIKVKISFKLIIFRYNYLSIFLYRIKKHMDQCTTKYVVLLKKMSVTLEKLPR